MLEGLEVDQLLELELENIFFLHRHLFKIYLLICFLSFSNYLNNVHLILMEAHIHEKINQDLRAATATKIKAAKIIFILSEFYCKKD